MKKDKLNTVEMVRRIRDNNYLKLKDKSAKERIEFYRAKAEMLDRMRICYKQDTPTELNPAGDNL